MLTTPWVIHDLLLEPTSRARDVLSEGHRLGCTINCGSRNSSEHPQMSVFLQSIFASQHPPQYTQSPAYIGEGVSGWVLVRVTGASPLLRSSRASFPVQPPPPSYAGCRLYEKGTLPGATFICEALILTMATSVRRREEPQRKARTVVTVCGEVGDRERRRLQPPP